MNDFVTEQISLSTADEEKNYFTGDQECVHIPDISAIFPPGSYRVIAGSLYRVVSGAGNILENKKVEG